MRTAGFLGLLLVLTSGADAKTRLEKPRRGFQMKAAKFSVQPGQDLEMCEYRRLPNRKAMDVSGFKLRMPPGAHHFVVWRYGGNLKDDSRFPQGPVESVGCTGVSPDEFVPQVMIPIQTPNARFRFPKGVALRIDPHEQVWLNSHLKNFDPVSIQPDIRFNFYRAKPGTVKHHAQGLIIGNITDIDIPPGGDQTITAEWTSPIDLTMIQLATHQHQLGTYANIELVEPDGITVTKIYENRDWEHPHSCWPREPLHFTPGRKIRITCTWHNPGDRAVHFGPETTDEMCFILGFYYREDDDTSPVVGGGCSPSKRGLLCPVAPVVATKPSTTELDGSVCSAQ